MRKTILVASLLASLSAAAQTQATREEALKAAFRLSADLKQMLATPIPTDPDVKRPVAVGKDKHGALVMPECKLAAEAVSPAGPTVAPIGQLWLRGLAFEDGPSPDKLLTVTLGEGENKETVLLCALGAAKSADGRLELLVYGKEKEPIQRAALQPITGQQENPIDLEVETQGAGATLVLKILGKYEARLKVVAD